MSSDGQQDARTSWYLLSHQMYCSDTDAKLQRSHWNRPHLAQVCILTHNEGILAAQLQHDWRQVCGCRLQTAEDWSQFLMILNCPPQSSLHDRSALKGSAYTVVVSHPSQHSLSCCRLSRKDVLLQESWHQIRWPSRMIAGWVAARSFDTDGFYEQHTPSSYRTSSSGQMGLPHLHDGLSDPSASHKDDLVDASRHERIPSLRIAVHNLHQIRRRPCAANLCLSHASSRDAPQAWQ